MKRKLQSFFFLLLVVASPALAVEPWYASTPSLSPGSTTSSLGAPINLTSPTLSYKFLDPVAISFYVVGASNGEIITIRTTATWANGSSASIDRTSQGGEVDLSPMEVSELGYSGPNCTTTSKCLTSPYDGNAPLATGAIVKWTFAVESDQANSAATVNYVAHFELH